MRTVRCHGTDASMRAAADTTTRRLAASDIRITRREPAALSAAEREDIAAFVTRSIPYPRARLDHTIDAADYLWLARDTAGTLVATTALRLVPARRGGRAVTLLYTAMLVIDPSCRRLNLVRRFGLRSYLRERTRAPLTPLYWMIFAASPAGFLQMARNFDTYWPKPGAPMPAAERDVLRQALAYLGIDKVEELDGCFRLPDDFGVTDPTQAPHRWDRSDPEVDFFLRVNPDYQRGSDLACLCPLSIVPLGAAIARQLRRRRHVRPSESATAPDSELAG